MARRTLRELAACGLLLGDDEEKNRAIATAVVEELGLPAAAVPSVLLSLRNVKREAATCAST